MANHLEEQCNSSSLLQKLVGENGLSNGLIYMGFSYGGGTSTSAAHQDTRAIGAISLDGLHQSTDLLGNPIRVPLLTFAQNAG